jgi:hypothetical protein
MTEPASQPEDPTAGPDSGPVDTTCGYANPDDFTDGDDIDSAAITEPDDGYQAPADPDAEPVGEPGDDEPGEDA